MKSSQTCSVVSLGGLWLLALLCLSRDARAAEPDCVQQILGGRDVAGLPAKPPVETSVELNLTSLRDVDSARQTFFADFYLFLSWKDERLGFDPVVTGFSECSVSEVEVWSGHERIWNPKLEFVNAVEEVEGVGENVVTIGSDGSCVLAMRVAGEFFSDFDLRSFPFDSQNLEIVLESHWWEQRDLRFESATVYTMEEENPEWKLVEATGTVGAQVYPYKPQPLTYSRYVYRIELERRPSYFIWRVAVPLLIILLISWITLWLGPGNFDAQMQVSVTCFLAAVAFNFVVSSSMPKISYLTIIDKWIVLTYAFILVTLAASVVRHLAANTTRSRPVERINRIGKWALLAVFVVVNALLAL